jgi:hypothetical protein
VRSTSYRARRWRLRALAYTYEPWVWPTCEIIHYLGLSLLLGTVGLFDLRVLGMVRAIPPRAIHRLVPFGVAGYCLNVLTGIMFFSGHPDQYFYNDSGRLKALLERCLAPSRTSKARLHSRYARTNR